MRRLPSAACFQRALYFSVLYSAPLYFSILYIYCTSAEISRRAWSRLRASIRRAYVLALLGAPIFQHTICAPRAPYFSYYISIVYIGMLYISMRIYARLELRVTGRRCRRASAVLWTALALRCGRALLSPQHAPAQQQ